MITEKIGSPSILRRISRSTTNPKAKEPSRVAAIAAKNGQS
jgi:hypothetical protein